jgi:hypothetical protein
VHGFTEKADGLSSSVIRDGEFLVHYINVISPKTLVILVQKYFDMGKTMKENIHRHLPSIKSTVCGSSRTEIKRHHVAIYTKRRQFLK